MFETMVRDVHNLLKARPAKSDYLRFFSLKQTAKVLPKNKEKKTIMASSFLST